MHILATLVLNLISLYTPTHLYNDFEFRYTAKLAAYPAVKVSFANSLCNERPTVLPEERLEGKLG
jgi:hypothetical protein